MFVQHPKDTKKGTFSLQKGKKGTPNLTSSWPLYNVFDKTNLKKKELSRAVSRSQTQF